MTLMTIYLTEKPELIIIRREIKIVKYLSILRKKNIINTIFEIKKKVLFKTIFLYLFYQKAKFFTVSTPDLNNFFKKSKCRLFN